MTAEVHTVSGDIVRVGGSMDRVSMRVTSAKGDQGPTVQLSHRNLEELIALLRVADNWGKDSV